jgi:large subunit ribosomal protein L3
MNSFPGVIGRKVGMTQLVAADGEVTPVTVIEVRCVVVGKRTKEKNGYDALVLGMDELTPKHTSKPAAGQFKKAGVAPQRILREFRCDAAYAATIELGQAMNLDDVFQAGQFVDVRGLSRGRGFTGVMRRHNFAGAKASHGVHEYKRHGGAIGTNMTPGRVKAGVGMPGQHGNRAISVLNQKVARVIADRGLVLLSGGTPGAANGILELRGAVKKNGGKAKPAAK